MPVFAKNGRKGDAHGGFYEITPLSNYDPKGVLFRKGQASKSGELYMRVELGAAYHGFWADVRTYHTQCRYMKNVAACASGAALIFGGMWLAFP